MNKLLSKTTKKLPLILMSGIAVLLVALSVLLSALIGVNYAAPVDDAKTITMQMNAFFYNTKLEEAEAVCEQEFERLDLKVEYVYKSTMSGDDCEIMYVFAGDTDNAKIASARTNVGILFDNKTQDANDTVFYGADISVTSGSETLYQEIYFSHVWRAVAAVGLFAVLSLVYVALRYKLAMGIVVAANTVLSAALTAAILLLTRIPVSPSAIYAIAVASLLGGIFTVFYFNKVRTALKAENDKKAEEMTDTATLVVNASAHKEIGVFAVCLGVALVLMGAIATTAVRWFAIVSLIGLVVAAATAIFYAPALYLPLQVAANKAQLKYAKGYVGAKKKDEE